MKYIFCIVLGVLVFFSAIRVVLAVHESRLLFLDIQSLIKQQDSLNEEWGRLQLEQSTWSINTRIAFIAKNDLQMEEPNIKFIRLVVPE